MVRRHGKQLQASHCNIHSKEGKLEAKISELSEEAESCSSKIEDLAASISANEKDLTDATAILNRETADFKESESALTQDVDTKVIAQAKKIVTESTGGAAYLLLQFSDRCRQERSG
jgi:predicted  nucleic acid-binding Zn-ribbon protein